MTALEKAKGQIERERSVKSRNSSQRGSNPSYSSIIMDSRVEGSEVFNQLNHASKMTIDQSTARRTDESLLDRNAYQARKATPPRVREYPNLNRLDPEDTTNDGEAGERGRTP